VIDRVWTLLGSREVADHRIFRIHHDLYRFEPSGKEQDFVVMHSADWVNVVPITEDGQVVLIRQYRHGIRVPTLEIPGGIIDHGEAPEVAAARELGEETGYSPARIRLLGRTRPNPAIQDNYQYSFLAEGCRKTSQTNLDPFEHIEVLLSPLESIPDLVRREEICNALVITAFAFLWASSL
jgi:ADP-ribose pyrophosphatase